MITWKTWCSLLVNALVLSACQGYEVGDAVLPVKDFVVSDPGVGKKLDISWVNSKTPGADYVRIIRFLGESCPNDDPETTLFDDMNEFEVNSVGQPQTWTDEEVSNRTEYCYSIYVRMGVEFSKGLTQTGTPICSLMTGPGQFCEDDNECCTSLVCVHNICIPDEE